MVCDYGWCSFFFVLLFFIIWTQIVGIVAVYLLLCGEHASYKYVHPAKEQDGYFHASFSASWLQWSLFFIVIAARDQIDTYYSPEGIKYQEEAAGWHQEHGTWIEFPPSPSMCILPSELGKSGVTSFVLIGESPRPVKCHFKQHDANYSLHQEIIEDKLLRKFTDAARFLEACEHTVAITAGRLIILLQIPCISFHC